MSRKMKHLETGSIIDVKEHIILKNFWEYYVVDETVYDGENPDTDTVLAYVMGLENELGYVYLPEIKPYIITKTNDLAGVMPAAGYDWLD